MGSDVAEAKASANYTAYGVLYNGVAARTACPAGWHTATEAEWTALEIYLGMSPGESEALNYRLSGKVGGKMKEAGTSHWISPNKGATNSSGLSLLPGGCRTPDGGPFSGVKTFGLYWTGTKWGYETNSWQRAFAFDSDGDFRANEFNNWGMSVRCVKNP